jgi:hypothetical protein
MKRGIEESAGKGNGARVVRVRVSVGEDELSMINATICPIILDDMESQCQKCRRNTIGFNGQCREYYFCRNHVSHMSRTALMVLTLLYMAGVY